jgi:CheY-like chemotaxis protein
VSSFFYVLDEQARLLFVDDDPILREFAQVNLASPNASVTVAEDGAEAMRLLEVESFDVLLVDLEMPVMDGFTVLERLRADPATRGLPVIVQTGREDVEAIDRAYRLGATSFVTKPLNWRLLSYQIRYVHRAHQAELSLLEARRRARTEASEVTDALGRVCTLGARFIADALRLEPSLKAPAAEYLEAIEQASSCARRRARE